MTINTDDQVRAEACGCAVIGPLLVAPGTSGRSWRCGECGKVWTP